MSNFSIQSLYWKVWETSTVMILCALLAMPLHAHDGPLFTHNAEVQSIYDGDTGTFDIFLPFDMALLDQKLRFFCVDTPEIRGPEKAEGLPVRDIMREWLPVGSIASVEFIEYRTGLYGRWLAIITPFGWDESVNARLLREGMAEVEAYSQRAIQACYDKLGVARQ